MTCECRVLLADEQATERLGECVGTRLEVGQGVALVGELGAGKTCFVRGLARGLDIDDPAAVCSPTYLLVIEHPGPLPLLHVDAYLPDKTRAFLEDGGVAYLAERRGVVAVEWADRIAELLPVQTLWVRLLLCRHGGVVARQAVLEDRCGAFAWLGDLDEGR